MLPEPSTSKAKSTGCEQSVIKMIFQTKTLCVLNGQSFSLYRFFKCLFFKNNVEQIRVILVIKSDVIFLLQMVHEMV